VTIYRLWFRRHRFMLAAFGVAVFAVGVLGIELALMATCRLEPSLSASLAQHYCELNLKQATNSNQITLILAVVPILLGLVLGVDAVGGEIQAGTAPLGWSITGNRRRWLADQMVPALTTAVAFALICGAINLVIVARVNPGHNLLQSYRDYEVWGVALVARALFGYALGLFFGAVSGRLVPALALGFVLIAVIAPAATVISRAMEPTHIVPQGDRAEEDGYSFGGDVISLDGTHLVPLTECEKAMPNFTPIPGYTLDPVLNPDPSMAPDPAAQSIVDQQFAWTLEHCPMGQNYLLGNSMPNVILRESSMVAVPSLLCGLGAFAIVRRRRPVN
jgi:hypothetical protein